MKSKIILIVGILALSLSAIATTVIIFSSPSYTGTVTITDETHTRKHCIVDVVTEQGEDMELRLGKGRYCNKVKIGETVNIENGRLAN